MVTTVKVLAQATEQQNSTTAAGSRIVLQQQLTLQTVTDLQSYY